MDDGFSSERYRDFVELSGDFVWEIDAASRFVFAAPRLVCGWSAYTLTGRKVTDFLVDAADIRHFAVNHPSDGAEVAFRTAEGGTAGLSLWARPVFGSSGVWNGARGLGRDSAGSNVHAIALNEARQRSGLMHHVVRALRDELNPEAALTTALTALSQALGALGGAVLHRAEDHSLRDIAGWGTKIPPAVQAQLRAGLAERRTDLSAVAAGTQAVARPIAYRTGTKGVVALWRRGESPAFNDFERAMLAEVADHLGAVLAQIEARERIELLSRTDPLTGLVNRGAFLEEFARRLGRTDRGTQTAALLYIDVLNLKAVNAAHGPAGGDAALVSLASILRTNSRAGDLIARFGGADFTLWIEGIDARGAAARASALSRAAENLAPLSTNIGRPFGISVGVALFHPARRESLPQLVARAAAEAAAAKNQDDSLMPASLQA